MRFSRSFSAKMLSITISIFLLFCAVSTVSWYKNFTKQATETAEEDINAVIKALSTNFEANLRDIDYVSALISNKVSTESNACMIRYLTENGQNTSALVTELHEAQNYLSNRCSFKTYLNGLAVYGFDGRACAYGITPSYGEVVKEDWFNEIKGGNAEIIYISPHDYTQLQPSPKGSQVFSIVRPVWNNGTIIGIVKADIKCKLLETLFDISSMDGYQLCVVDNNNGDLIFASNEELSIAPAKLLAQTDGTHGHYSTSVSKTNYLVVYSSSKVTPWTFYGIVEKNTVISGFIAVRRQMILMVLVCIAGCCVLALWATKMATKDLRQLSKALSDINDENLQLSIDVQSKDEVGVLYFQVCSMLERIRRLFTDIRTKESEKRKAEIEMLSMQINPHFLHNTLNTIKVLAVMQGVPNIEKVSNALSNMLHLNLDSRTFISISEEQQYLEDYLEIQGFRYAGKFTYSIHVEPEIACYMIPKLLIQPIVENALQHGIACSEEDGFVQIRISCQEDMIHIAVKNSGKEFDSTLLQGQLYCGKESSHIGLNNISRRLKLFFGNDGALKIFSEPNMFTMVEITMPKITTEEVSKYDKDHGC